MTKEEAYQKLATFMRSQLPTITTHLATPQGSYQEVVFKGKTSRLPIIEQSVISSRMGNFG